MRNSWWDEGGSSEALKEDSIGIVEFGPVIQTWEPVAPNHLENVVFLQLVQTVLYFLDYKDLSISLQGSTLKQISLLTY